MDKKDAVYRHKGILLSHKKNEMMSFAATRIDLEIKIILLSKISQKEKDKCHMLSLMCEI